MITVDAPISFLVGAGIALACKDRERPAVAHRDRTLAHGLLFQGTVLTPLILFFLVRFPDWEWNYLFDAQGFFFGDGASGWRYGLLAAIVAALTASFYAGFRVVEWALRRGRDDWAKGVIGAAAVVILATMAAMYEQTLHLGSLAAFRRGEAPLIFEVPEFLVVQGVASLLVGPGILLIVWLNRRRPAPSA